MSLQVFIKLEGQKMSLIVDGISVQSNRISGRDRTHLTAPLYAGGVPASVAVSVSPAGSTLRLTPLCSEGRAFLLFFTLGTEALCSFLTSGSGFFRVCGVHPGSDAERSPCRRPRSKPGDSALLRDPSAARSLLFWTGRTHHDRYVPLVSVHVSAILGRHV